MASAWGKLTGQPGLCLVTRGPGVTNASIGIHTAMQDSAPMLVFVGQVGTDMKGREAFQEIDDPAVFGTMATWAVEIDRLPEVLSRAWITATTGRPGPVVVALPEDMLTALTEVAPLPGPVRIHAPAPSAAAVDEALTLRAKAKRPVLLVGGVNWSAQGRAALESFATASDLPVVAAFRYQDRFDNHAPQYVGKAGVGMPPHIRALIQDADVIPAVNVRFAGDDDFQMNLQELATAAQYAAGPVVLILNNGIYGTIRAHQERNYPGRISGTTMVNPDFAALARACGFHGERVKTTEAFPAAFARAQASPTGAVLDLNISPEALTPRQTLSQMRAAALARS